jgi:toxin ParE1/3/4
VKPPVPELSGRARRDLDEIRAWTIEAWGRGQWQVYYRGLGAAFRRISAEPDCGRPRDLLAKGMRSLVYEKHLIFFAPVTQFGGQPVILRILHQRRNLAAVAYLDDLEG